MPDTKITALTAIGANPIIPSTFPIPMVDLTDTSMAASGTTKKVTVNQILGAGGTATLASATITGDLTVDTSTLKVDSANNRVGIGTASPTAGMALDIVSATSNNFVRFTDGVNATGYLGIRAASGAAYLHGNNNVVSLSCSTSNTTPTEQLRITNPGVFEFLDGAGGTRMTLNSTGLLVGATATSYGAAGRGLVLAGGSSSAMFGMRVGSTDTGYLYADATKVEVGYLGVPLLFNNGAVRMTLDTSGNVGIGVTPSAWGTYKALEIGTIGTGMAGQGYETHLLANCYYNAGWKYARTERAARFAVGEGLNDFRWFTAPSGTAGNAITFTQAMTLDASGNLLVGTTNAASNNGIGLKASYSATAPYYATVGSSNASNAYSYLLYSTTDAAFKFYVSYSGTVSATNGTISAISDARLKENVQDIDVGLGAILALKPRKFDWKAGKGKDIKGDRGFIAQEFETVFPNLVDEWKDAAPEGEAPYKSVRQDLIPVLVKAIQELTARVEALEA
jgi:hypothetical protein